MTKPSDQDEAREAADRTEVIGLHDRSCAWVLDFSGKTECGCPRGQRRKAFTQALLSFADQREKRVREECAKIADDYYRHVCQPDECCMVPTTDAIANAIRSGAGAKEGGSRG